MSFLHPWTALVAGAAAVCALILLYLLKLRRRRQRVASTMLWRQSFEDLQVNVPFQRLRATPLFLLQLLAILLLLAALAQPILQTHAGRSRRMILLIDQSASMSAVEGRGADGGPRRRLDEARQAAKDIVRRQGRGSSEVMLVRFGAAARVVSGFESDRRVLFDAIDSIPATDEPANLQAALDLAGAFVRVGEDEEAPIIVLISDGAVADDSDRNFQLRSGDFRFVRVGQEPVDNVGISALTVRRQYRDPANVLVFARLLNAGREAVETVVTLSMDDEPVSWRRVTLPAATSNEPGEATISFSLEDRDGGVLRLGHDHRDQLAADDMAAVVVPPPARPRLALIHPSDGPDAFLLDMVEALGARDSARLTETAYAQIDPEQIDSGSLFDLIVFDRVSPSRLPGVPSVIFGGVPASVGAQPPSAPGGYRLETWSREDPIMRYVALDDLAYTGFGHYVLGADASAIASGPEGPVIIELRRGDVRHVAVGFALTDSNWPLDVSFVVFLQNILDQLAPLASGQSGIAYTPGEPIPARIPADLSQVSIVGPTALTVTTPEGGRVTLPALPLAGLYAAEGVLPPNDRLALSLLTSGETDIRPRESVTVNASDAVSSGIGAAAPLPLWPWLAGAAFALLIGEWLVYCRRRLL